MSATRSEEARRTAGRLTGCAALCLAAFAGPGFGPPDAAADAPGRYLGTDEFLSLAFGEERPEAKVLWMPGDVRDALAKILGHPFAGLRVRYWQQGERTAWILEEIGKELPITIGVAVENGQVALVRILEFREIRGWEVRYPFFTDQFQGVALTDRRDLDARIDGITGATLSVAAVKGIAKVALLLHEHVTSDEQ